jgi:hypothetical protein
VPQHLTTPWASTACYRDTHTLLFYQDSNPSLSPRHTSRRYFQQPYGLRLQRHKHEANDSHSKGTKLAKPCGIPPSIPCYLNKNKICSSWIALTMSSSK